MAVGTSSCSSSPSSSLSSFSSLSSASAGDLDDSTPRSTVKFLCSYGGKILPRYPDGKLRYRGGETRVLAVDRTIPFSELLAKLGELSGWDVPVSLRCQLPTEDLDALVSVTSDEDLVNLIEEYDVASRGQPSPLKIRAFLFLFNSSHNQQKKGKPPAFSPIRYACCGHHHHHQPACSLRNGRPSSSHYYYYRHHYHQQKLYNPIRSNIY